MSRRAALFGLLLGTVAVALFALLSSPSNVIRTHGGGELSLTAVTHGTVNKYPGRDWRNRLARFLPDAIARKLRSRGASISTASTNVVFWFERSGGEVPRVVVCDRAGIGFGQTSCAISAGTGTEGGWVEGVGFSVVPRREKEILLRLYAQTNIDAVGQLLGEIKVQNPLWGTYPTWTPEPLPATRETNGLTVTLRELKAGVRWSGPMEEVVPGDGADIGVRAVFDITKDGILTDAWASIGIETSDATGNQVQHQGWKSSFENGHHTIHYRWGLWPSESAWKLKVQIARRSGFATDQLWTVRGFSLVDTNLRNALVIETNLQGAVVHLGRTITENAFLGTRTIQLSVNPYREDHRLTLVQANDDLERTVPVVGEGWSPRAHQFVGYSFDLRPAPNAKSLNLTFALQQSCHVEFVVKPELLRATNAATASASTSVASRKDAR
jgi:hypothetical protein